jgi:hypothetical protein
VLNSKFLNNFFLFILLTKALSNERAFSQEHISNGDCSNFAECPELWSQRATDFKLIGWWSPTKATPDGYHQCSKQCGTRENWLGGAVGTNKGYVGIVIQSFNSKAETNYREYIQTELISPLQSGATYQFSLRVYFPLKCAYITTDLGVIFSSTALRSVGEGLLSYGTNHPIALPIYQKERGKWHTIDLLYVAKGGEKFLTLGNFFFAMEQPTLSDGEVPLSYLFLDDISLTSTEKIVSPTPFGITYSRSKVELLDDIVHSSSNESKHEKCSCFNCSLLRGEYGKETVRLESLTDFEVKAGQRIDLNEIIFDYETGSLLPESKMFLHRLVFFLSEVNYVDLRLIIYTYESNPKGEEIAHETSINLYQLLRKSGVTNKISFIHATKNSLSRPDGRMTDRNIELLIVKTNLNGTSNN